jgi:hypothetical protein
MALPFGSVTEHGRYAFFLAATPFFLVFDSNNRLYESS